jgi:hypothetical protein
MKKKEIFQNLEKSGKQIKGVGKKIVKKVPKQYKLFGKVAKGTGKILKSAIKNPLTTAAVLTTGYIAGGSSRRYAKSPKVGEGRDLRDTIMAMSKDYYS